jgi:hypothetical protein
VASFVGPTSLWEALARVAGVQGLVIEVHLLPLLHDTSATRHTLATHTEIAVRSSTDAAIRQPRRDHAAGVAIGQHHHDQHSAHARLATKDR